MNCARVSERCVRVFSSIVRKACVRPLTPYPPLRCPSPTTSRRSVIQRGRVWRSPMFPHSAALPLSGPIRAPDPY